MDRCIGIGARTAACCAASLLNANMSLAAPLPVQLLDNIPEKKVGGGPTPRDPALIWESWRKHMPYDFGLAQLQLLEPFGQ